MYIFTCLVCSKVVLVPGVSPSVGLQYVVCASVRAGADLSVARGVFTRAIALDADYPRLVESDPQFYLMTNVPTMQHY
jgi:hypothetical protein